MRRGCVTARRASSRALRCLGPSALSPGSAAWSTRQMIPSPGAAGGLFCYISSNTHNVCFGLLVTGTSRLSWYLAGHSRKAGEHVSSDIQHTHSQLNAAGTPALIRRGCSPRARTRRRSATRHESAAASRLQSTAMSTCTGARGLPTGVQLALLCFCSYSLAMA